MFCNIRNEIAKEVIDIQRSARVVSILDVLCSFATVAINYNYTKPNILKSGEIRIKEGRHPVVENL